MAVLDSKKRNRLKSSTFGEPASRKYPMPDRSHAANAKARATQMVKAGKLSSSEAAKIKAKANRVLGEGGHGEGHESAHRSHGGRERRDGETKMHEGREHKGWGAAKKSEHARAGRKGGKAESHKEHVKAGKAASRSEHHRGARKVEHKGGERHVHIHHHVTHHGREK